MSDTTVATPVRELRPGDMIEFDYWSGDVVATVVDPRFPEVIYVLTHAYPAPRVLTLSVDQMVPVLLPR